MVTRGELEGRGKLALVRGGEVTRAQSLGRIRRASVMGDSGVRLGIKSKVGITDSLTRNRPLYEDCPNHDD
jgi:hypothetical protein